MKEGTLEGQELEEWRKEFHKMLKVRAKRFGGEILKEIERDVIREERRRILYAGMAAALIGGLFIWGVVWLKAYNMNGLH